MLYCKNLQLIFWPISHRYVMEGKITPEFSLKVQTKRNNWFWISISILLKSTSSAVGARLKWGRVVWGSWMLDNWWQKGVCIKCLPQKMGLWDKTYTWPLRMTQRYLWFAMNIYYIIIIILFYYLTSHTSKEEFKNGISQRNNSVTDDPILFFFIKRTLCMIKVYPDTRAWENFCLDLSILPGPFQSILEIDQNNSHNAATNITALISVN